MAAQIEDRVVVETQRLIELSFGFGVLLEPTGGGGLSAGVLALGIDRRTSALPSPLMSRISTFLKAGGGGAAGGVLLTEATLTFSRGAIGGDGFVGEDFAGGGSFTGDVLALAVLALPTG